MTRWKNMIGLTVEVLMHDGLNRWPSSCTSTVSNLLFACMMVFAGGLLVIHIRSRIQWPGIKTNRPRCCMSTVANLFVGTLQGGPSLVDIHIHLQWQPLK
ncbi:unnamed protein product [Musa acuminata subsp. burmannicoides]